MRNPFPLLLAAVLGLASFPQVAHAQQLPCTTTNAGGCGCRDGSVDCDLLPDITISWDALQHYLNGPDEFGQTGHGVDNGRLKITGSTPNIGYGSFTVRGTNWFVCGADTFQYTQGTPPPCADGAMPHQLLYQRVYHKAGAAMSHYDRFAGAMTYHPTHGHNHVDDWSIFTLRLRDSTQTDPRQWPIVGTGAKVGFCLMDYYPCVSPSAYGHCRDSNAAYLQGRILSTTGQFRNYGLGGGQYNCSPIEQGISAGYTDVYSENLDGMWINIPPGTCNGEYWVVMEVDPHNFFLEEDETNNYTAAPVTLTQQNPAGQGVASISSNHGTFLCQGETLELTATPGFRYAWNNGATSRTINVSQPGAYTVTVTNHCGVNTSVPFMVTGTTAPAAPLAAQGAVVCGGQAATLSATAPAGNGVLEWFDGNGTLVGRGASYTTPALQQSATYFVKNANIIVDSAHALPANNTFANGGFYTSNNAQGLNFNADLPFVLESCLVYANSAGARTIELRNDYGLTVATRLVTLPAGPSRVPLNLPVPAGIGWKLLLISTGSTGGNLYRNSAGAQFPYTVPGVMSITGSTAGADFYYFFYDWKVTRTVSDCGSQPLSVTATVGTPVISMAPLPATLALNATPVALVGTPAGGTFSGPGILNGMFYPSVAGVGGPYTLTYTYTVAGGGCGGSTGAFISVTSPLAVAAPEAVAGALRVLPNPAHDQLRVELPGVQAPAQLELLDLVGRAVVRRTLNASATGIGEDVRLPQGLPAGTYILRLTAAGQRFARRVVVE